MKLIKNQFHIPESLNAAKPPEIRNHSRADVRMMVLDSLTGKTDHNHFTQIGQYLQSGDLLVFNNSRTIPSHVKGYQDGNLVSIRLAKMISSNRWEALLINGKKKMGSVIRFEDHVEATINSLMNDGERVELVFSEKGIQLYDFLYRYGMPIRYEYINTPWPLHVYQTVYGSVPGSVEMTSAGRPFTWRLMKELKDKGVHQAFIQLHTGLSYYENDIWPNPEDQYEFFSVSDETAKTINDTKNKGGKIIAVGTTVVRALESAALAGSVEAKNGETNLYITENYPLQVVDGLITGLHEPEASHLHMLQAFVDKHLLLTAYEEAVREQYLWHEFGDMNFILPLGVK
ncbi:S-adenosylmethionine:tRNA ribosyltransferase-isomerase [Salirhabdus salicampi]|uniref:S-adenosylmethionine:tRNA ribosyltransferase-isomerase n=1 Tax=Salirhabdus salicampi TaxID=476102 RepID=UPI0020C3EA4B|nr:S-adenosylmethionine:tRNA ribosyltransferase-isomerase [Salirhabdus salicampi]MCP8617360.1 S-adenosylmethionine:tRNA ribosyltransferase-isomerase [Salirhabdus salicampi]